ncbi:hypothetical protein Hanom_Chr01g00070451 [Helianthus anomalus]
MSSIQRTLYQLALKICDHKPLIKQDNINYIISKQDYFLSVMLHKKVNKLIKKCKGHVVQILKLKLYG